MKKTLTAIALAGMIGLTGCAGSTEYHFKGSIDGERIIFLESYSGNLFHDSDYLSVKKNDKWITYLDLDSDGKIDEVEIQYSKENRVKYKNDKLGKPVLELAQKQYDEYLKKILEHKQQEALKALESEEEKK